MNKFLSWLENDLAPAMNRISSNIWILTLKDSIMQVLPFIFLGSLFCLFTIPSDILKIENYPNFWVLFGWTMGLLSLLLSFLIPFNLMEKKRLFKQRFIAGCTGLVAFLMIISPQVIADEAIGFSHSALGAGGMFVAIIAGLFTGYIMQLFGKFSFFKEDSVIPDFVRAWFDAMLPIGLDIIIIWLIVDIIQFDLFVFIQSIFAPLGNVLETPWGFSFTMFLFCFIYSMGISSWILDPITRPLFLAAITANIAGASNVVTYETIWLTYLWVGGIGCTLPLVIMLFFSKSTKLNALGRACLLPGIFNINEPVVFGAIAWNPLLMVPMWIIGAILPLIVWFGTKVINFAPIPKIVFTLWYTPFPLSTWLATGGSIRAVIFLFVCVSVATIIWYPFFKIYERQELKTEFQN